MARITITSLFPTAFGRSRFRARFIVNQDGSRDAAFKLAYRRAAFLRDFAREPAGIARDIFDLDAYRFAFAERKERVGAAGRFELLLIDCIFTVVDHGAKDAERIGRGDGEMPRPDDRENPFGRID